MAIKFSQFNERTDHTSGMYLVGYDGNQNIHITVDNLFNDFINGTANQLAMFGSGGDTVVDSIASQNSGATQLDINGQLYVDSNTSLNEDLTVTGDSTLNGNVILGDASTDLITQTGTLYLNGPVKDTTDTLGAADQVLLSDATGELTFTDVYDLNIGSAETVSVPVKNVQGSALVKGDPVYISGSVGASGRLEVQLADASNALKMPAVGLLKQDLANNEEGFAVVTGKLTNLITDPIGIITPTENDILYVKPSGVSGNALTLTKPVYGNFIQNIGKVGRVSTSNDGNFIVSSILRTNDIPNLAPGRLWVGSGGNTIESQTVFVNEAARTVGINTTTPQHALTVDGNIGISNYIEHNGDNNTRFGFESNDVFILNTSSTERLRVSPGGNVGINTSSPQRTLDVNGVILSSNRSGQAFRAEPDNGSGFAVTEFFNDNPILRLARNTGQDTVKIQALGDSFFKGGKVSIGTSPGSAQLHAATSGNFPAAKITNTHSSGTGLVVEKTSSGVGDIQRWQYTNNTVKAVVDSEGKFGIGLTNPLFDLDVYGSKGLRARRSTSTDGFAIVALNSLTTPTSACGIYYTNNVGSLILNDTTQNQNVKIQALGDSYIKGGRVGIGADLTTARSEAKLFVKDGDIQIDRPNSGNSGGGIILHTPDKQNRYKLTIDNNGNLVTTQV